MILLSWFSYVLPFLFQGLANCPPITPKIKHNHFFDTDDDKYGQDFHSKHFPALKYFIHTGFDIETGCLNYKSLFLTNPQTSAVDAFAKATSDDLPFYAKAAKGGSVSFISQAKALEDRTFDFANKFIGKQYFETV